jgi:beta-lactamase superfamily II metal-dependent hydrolase
MSSSKKRTGRKLVAVLIVLLVMIVILAVAATSIPKIKDNDTSGNGDIDEGQHQNEPSASNSTSVRTYGNSTVYFIDVGQGDAELIKTSDGKNVLIDAGPPSAGSTLVSFLESHNSTTLDAFVLTHPDADHIGGGADVMKACSVLSIYQSGYSTGTKTFAAFEAAVKLEGCPSYNDTQLNPGDRLLSINSTVTFEIMAINAQSGDANDASVVIKMTDGTVDFMFEGDASSSVESQMDNAYGDAMDIEILKIGHHGSSSATSASFLSATTPAVAVIEVGTGNIYGHPTNQTLDRLRAAGSQVYRTDLNGTIAITTDGTSWAVSCER